MCGVEYISSQDGLKKLELAGCAQEADTFMRVGGAFHARYGKNCRMLLFSPGRTELCGNHTDHQCGKVIAAAIKQGIAAAVGRNVSGRCRLFSEGFGYTELDITEPYAADKARAGSTAALILGTADYLSSKGYAVGGFDAELASTLPAGGGLSSSAAFAVLCALIQSALYNDAGIPQMELAKAAQYAESVNFGKPCGLMDQAACALGGVQMLDFFVPCEPKSVELEWSMADRFSLMLVNTGSSHADLTDEYALIVKDMTSVAEALGKSRLGYTDKHRLIESIPKLRSMGMDRAILRAMHFFDEQRRVVLMCEALISKDYELYRRTMGQSGISSETMLQNICPKDANERSLALAISLARMYLGDTGAARVHGGGFAGCMQALVPKGMQGEFKDNMELVFGKNSVFTVEIRKGGACVAMELGPLSEEDGHTGK